MSYSKVIGLALCLQLLSYSVSAQNAAAGATAVSGSTPSPAAGSTSYATAIATALSSGDAQAAATAIAAAQSAGQSSAYAAAFSQACPTQQIPVTSWQTERWSFGCFHLLYIVRGFAGQVVGGFSLGGRTGTRYHAEDQQRRSIRSSLSSCQLLWSCSSFPTPGCCKRPSCCTVSHWWRR